MVFDGGGHGLESDFLSIHPGHDLLVALAAALFERDLELLDVVDGFHELLLALLHTVNLRAEHAE